jgi:hypothetical protein
VFVACFPKSGSTYLCRLLAHITGMRKKTIQRAGPGSAYWEQDICATKLQKLHFVPSVVHQHVKGTPPNVHLLEEYGILPIVQTRHVADAILSLHDHIERESAAIPVAYIPREYAAMDRGERLDFLINATMPWYLAFYVSWKEASQSSRCLWTSYEELFADQVCEVSRIATFCGLSVSMEEIRDAIASMDRIHTRKNVGVSGRGRQLSDKHKRLVNSHASAWKLQQDDLQRLGLPLPVAETSEPEKTRPIEPCINE